jgi:hypothetical protein
MSLEHMPETNAHTRSQSLTDRKLAEETHEMLTELMEVLRPMRAMVEGLGPMQKMGMSPQAKAAAARIKALG